MTPVAESLAAWAAGLEPSDDDLALARRSLVDTVAVAIAARAHPIGDLLGELSDAEAWAVLAHVLDFDDLHMGSTSHVSAVCVPAVLATGGDARAYLAGAGVMARLGTALGWPHYAAGWHATCTAGAPGAAAGAAVALGLGADEVATAMALAVPAAGGVQRAFGTAAKALQVGAAAQAGVRAARLAAAGASADPRALDQWLALVGGDADRLALDGPAVPGGLAVKLFPCCYALQRPIAALRALDVDPEQGRARGGAHAAERARPAHPRRADDRPGGQVQPAVRRRGHAARRPARDRELHRRSRRPARGAGAPGARRGRRRARRRLAAGRRGRDRGHARRRLDSARGARPPARRAGAPAVGRGLAEKVADCTGDLADEVLALDWLDAGALLRERLPGAERAL